MRPARMLQATSSGWLHDIERPKTLAELLAPIHEDFRKSGMSEEELETFLESELAEARQERKDAKGQSQQ